MLLRAVLAVAAVAALSAAAPESGSWACVPAALLLVSEARRVPGSVAGVVIAVAAAAAGSAGAAPVALQAAVAVASALVLHGTRSRLQHEREAMRRSALRDPLTGLANRRGLDERIAYEIARHSRERRRFAVVAIDLDGFKGVNDRFGHHAGDELLRDVAAALGGAVREQDTVARLGGDEFCVLAPETDRHGGAHLAVKLERAIGGVTAGLEAVGASVGAAVFPDDGRDALTVLEAADAAQVRVKRDRSGRRFRAA